MTVAAVILAANPDVALADADGVPRVRRIAEAAWSGGALPVVVVADDPDGRMASALAGVEARLVTPGPAHGGPVARIVRGIDAAQEVIEGTTAALVWPARMCWAGPETVTSLIEQHGASPTNLLRPAFEDTPGWPALLPLSALGRLRRLDAGLMPEGLLTALTADGVETASLDLGDPGTTIDGDTPRAALPPYLGPAPDSGRHDHEWGAAVASTTEGL